MPAMFQTGQDLALGGTIARHLSVMKTRGISLKPLNSLRQKLLPVTLPRQHNAKMPRMFPCCSTPRQR